MTQVLLIEPDKVLAETYILALKSANISAASVGVAQKAITKIDKLSPSLIILEMQLADHNGVEFLHELRSHHDWQKIPVLIVSMVPSKELGLTDTLRNQFGVVDYAYKPYLKLAELISLVQKHLRREEA